MMRSIDSKVGMVSRRGGGGWTGILKYSYKVCFFFQSCWVKHPPQNSMNEMII